jgi:uncharacterized protein (DUF1800 family)
VQDGETVLGILLTHPSTARFISYKMTRWLLRYDPPEALVERVAQTFTETSGDIPSMIRQILTPANLLSAPMKYRQPYQLMLAQMRATQPRVTSVALMRAQLNTLGQPLLQWEDPDGWPDRVDWWAGLILQRWNFSNYIATRTAEGFVVDVAPLMTTPTPDGVSAAVMRRVFPGQSLPTLEAQLRTYLAGAGPINATRVQEALSLALSANEFQWY